MAQSVGGQPTLLEKAKSTFKAIAFELKPFSLPSKDDLRRTWTSVETACGEMYCALKELLPQVMKVARETKGSTYIKGTAWSIGWLLFSTAEFGFVYVILSLIAFMFINLGERKEGDWSAYSVFNDGCRAIMGAINAEQFEREIMHRNQAAGAPEEEEDQGFVMVDHLEEAEQEAAARAAVGGGKRRGKKKGRRAAPAAPNARADAREDAGEDMD